MWPSSVRLRHVIPTDTLRPKTRLDRLDAVGITRGVLALCLVWLLAFGPVVQPLYHAGAPRMALTDALVTTGDVKIDGYQIGVDYVERDGHLYSDKALGQQVLAIPPYLAARAVGAEPASVDRFEKNLTVWWVTLWNAGIPFVALILMTAVAANRRGRAVPLPALVGLMFGTMLLPFSVILYGHLLGTALGFAAWLVLDGDDHPPGRAWLAGLLAGLGALVEYQVAIVVVTLGVALLLRRSWGPLIRFLAAGVPMVAAMLVYQGLAFGSPFRSGYDEKAVHQDATFLITGVPKFSNAWSFLLGSRGLLIFTPIVAVGLWSLIHRWRSGREEGVGVALAVCSGFLLLQAGWVNPWGGESPGPRYLIPMLPFLVLGLAEVWPTLPAAARNVVLAVSLTSMVLPALTEHLVGDGGILLLEHLGKLLRDGPMPTMFTMAVGPIGWIPHLVLVGLGLRLLRQHWSGAPGAAEQALEPEPA